MTIASNLADMSIKSEDVSMLSGLQDIQTRIFYNLLLGSINQQFFNYSTRQFYSQNYHTFTIACENNFHSTKENRGRIWVSICTEMCAYYILAKTEFGRRKDETGLR